jgi:hypothetical protein
MPITGKCRWTYPEKYSVEWYEVFGSLLTEQDEAVYAAREDRNLLIMAECEFSFVSGTGEVSWDASIDILGPTTGKVGTIGADTAVLLDGEMLVVPLVRSPQDDLLLSVEVVERVTDSVGGIPLDQDSVLVLAIRRGASVFFRNGIVLHDGDACQVFSGSDSMRKGVYDTNDDGKVDAAEVADTATMADAAKAINDGVYTASALQLEYARKRNWDSMVLHLGMDKVATQAVPALSCSQFHWYNGYWGYGFWGLAEPAYYFTVVAWVAGPTPGTTVKVELYNLTDGELVTGTDLTTGSGTPVVLKSPVLLVGGGAGQLRNVESLYEVRVTLIGAADPADFGYLGSSSLRFIHTIV